MDPEKSKELFDQNAFFVFLDTPSDNFSFGIDFNEWKTGPKFKGMKMIPPGLHYVYFILNGDAENNQSKNSIFKVGRFIWFDRKSAVVKTYSPEAEDFKFVNDAEKEKEESLKIYSQRYNLDQFLAPFSFDDSYLNWTKLTSYIDKNTLNRITGINNRNSNALFTSQEWNVNSFMTSFYSIKEELLLMKKYQKATGNTDCEDMHNYENANKFMEDKLNFIEIDLKKLPENTPIEAITSVSLDKSWLLKSLLLELNGSENLLGEFQFAFILFLVVNNYEGFEHWKTFIFLFSGCSVDFLKDNQTLFTKFVEILTTQLKNCPLEFFDHVDENLFSIIFKNLKNLLESPLCCCNDLNKKKMELFNTIQKLFPNLFLLIDNCDDVCDELPVVICESDSKSQYF